MLYHENKAKKDGFSFIIGVDEAGRGPLAGPVVASAVVLKNRRFKNRIYDSKKLSSKAREMAFHEIYENSSIGVGIVNEAVIDRINILEATRIAMEKAVLDLVSNFFTPLEKIGVRGDSLTGFRKKELKKGKISNKIYILVDGNHLFLNLPYKYKNIVAGDTKSLSIASASIIAKVIRDRIMSVYDKLYPKYGFSKHKGYGTRQHLEALKINGPSLVHRRSFRPIRCQSQN